MGGKGDAKFKMFLGLELMWMVALHELIIDSDTEFEKGERGVGRDTLRALWLSGML
jgi:hypothetical protein